MTALLFDHAQTGSGLARIERMMEQYRLAKKRRLQRQVIALWRKLEAQRAIAQFEQPPERIH